MTELLEVIDARIERSAAAYDRTMDELVEAHGELERLAAIRELAAGLEAPEPAEDADALTDAQPAGRIAAHRAAPAAPAPEPTPAAAPPPAQKATKPGPERSRADRVYDVIAAGDGPVSRAEIAKALDCTPGGLSKPLSELTDGGRIVRVGGLKDGGFQPTETADAQVAERPQAARTGASKPLAVLIRDVMATLEQDPGLTEEQLAQALDLDREDIAVATGELLSREWIVLRPDGTYEPAESDGGGAAVTGTAPTTALEGLTCSGCGTQLRERAASGLCGFCEEPDQT